ncbi:unnamed protein product [Thelazia callipaeda]|uniref:Expressed conserved protein n=1 Tax=Thelazia callipaeda TaxID=103827 RepID=A0A0N5CMV4_THECL|nr:unnamed protein product [Thelazia callipaeda]
MVMLILDYVRSFRHPKNVIMRPVHISSMAYTPAFLVSGVVTLIGFTTYLLLKQVREERRDEWKEGYTPNYPKIPWHLDKSSASDVIVTQGLAAPP